MVSPRYSRSSQKFGIIVVIFYRKKSKFRLTKKTENHSRKINATDNLLGWTVYQRSSLLPSLRNDDWNRQVSKIVHIDMVCCVTIFYPVSIAVKVYKYIRGWKLIRRKNLVLNEELYQYISLPEEQLVSDHQNSDFCVICHMPKMQKHIFFYILLHRQQQQI